MKIDDDTKKIIEEEMYKSFLYFWNESNTADPSSRGYGLTNDTDGKGIASIAAVGFALPAYVIGIENKYISYQEGYERVLKTLTTMLNIDSINGFFVHFVDQKTGANRHSEYSTIDTAIFLMGAVVVGEYFKGEIKDLVDYFLNRCSWEWLVTKINDKYYFKMAYSPEIYKTEDGFNRAYWGEYAEQLMMYILYAGQPKSNKALAYSLYRDFNRDIGAYKGENLVFCYGNPLFIHQFSHCFFNFKDYVDDAGFSWFTNSKNATLANRKYCMDQHWSKTYSKCSWGLTAFLGKNGYRVFGAPPMREKNMIIDGSVAPYAAISSIVFTPRESIEAIKYFDSLDGLKGKYGFKDSYNFEDGEYYCPHFLGIDKGPELIMLDNFLHGTVWKLFMSSKTCKRAIRVLGFKRTNKIYK